MTIPTAAQCLAVLAPLLGLTAFCWMLARLDGLIHHLFPSLEWQRQLGWLNIRAERRAATVLRWLGYGVYATLAAALYGIAWGAVGLRALHDWSDPTVMGHLLTRLPVLFTCLGFWIFYLAASLLPKLRREYEQEELARFRAEFTPTDQDEKSSAASRLVTGQHVLQPPVPPRLRSQR